MALSHTLPIYIDTYKLILLIFERTSNFGREYKYTLGQDMKRDGINLVRSIHRANRSKEKHYKFKGRNSNHQLELILNLKDFDCRHFLLITLVQKIQERQLW